MIRRSLLLAGLLTFLVVGAVRAQDVSTAPGRDGAREGGAAAGAVAREAPRSIRAVQAEPWLHRGAWLEVEGRVVRTTRRGPVGTGSSLLLRDDRGDTISVHEPATLPAVGSRVRVRGSVGVDPAGGVALVRGDGSPVLVVLEPANVPEADGDASLPAGAGAGPCEAATGLSRFSCSTGVPGWLLGGATAVLLVTTAGVIVLALRQPREEEAEVEIPLIVDLAAARAAAAPAERPDGEPRLDLVEPAAAVPRPIRRADRPDHAAASAVAVGGPRPGVTGPVAAGRESDVGAANAAVGDLLQLLPGRLEVIEGRDVGPEIRFFRVSSLQTPEITLGRDEGPPYRHIRLAAPTVSRVHARIRYVDRQWRITNLSEMNPIALNDEVLDGAGEERPLLDRDRIRIGEFLFRFRNGRG